MRILGIETSCDETAAAVVDGDRRILSSLVLSQMDEHQAFGGVVPEIAARSHLDHLDTLIRAALEESGTHLSELDGIAATCGPGLIGGLLVGMMAGKAIAAARNIPFIAVNHLEGHALTPRLTDDIEFPYLLLLVSGGHTQILVVEGVGKYKRWGTTLDDAAGECFDKSAKLMGLPYPGGPHLEKIAAQCKNPDAALKRFDLPRPMKGRREPDFSFSGLKTAVRNHIDALPPGELQQNDIADLAFSLQTAIADVLADRSTLALKKFIETYKALHHHPTRGRGDGREVTFVVSGGVAANGTVRTKLEEVAKRYGITFCAPPLDLCSDNAAMIAWAGLERLRAGMMDSLDFRVRPRWPLDPAAAPRQGAGIKA